MIAKLRYFVSRLMPEGMKEKITLFLSDLVYSVSTSLKGAQQLWLEDEAFMRLYNNAKSRILLDKGRAYNLYKLAIMQSSQPGDFAELGCYKCGSILFLSAGDSLVGKNINLMDTFQGMPKTSEFDPFWKPGDMSNISFEEIQGYCRKNLVRSKYSFHRGYFPQEINLSELSDLYAFVHIDTDLYESTLEGLRFFYERLSSKGIVLVDDFGNLSCPGVTKAVKDFCESKKIEHIYLTTGQAMR
jgi:O-methyltransferase